MADYGGSVSASIGDNTQIDNVTDLTVSAALRSGDDIVIDLPDDDNITVKAVNSTVIGASVGGGYYASIAQVNLAENASATIGENVTVTTNTDSGAMKSRPTAMSMLRSMCGYCRRACCRRGILCRADRNR